MKSLFIILLLISFSGLAAGGLFAMNHSNGHDSGGCIGATAQGVECPQEANPIDFFAFHLDAFKSFSLAIFGESSMNLLLLILALVWGWSIVFLYSCSIRQFPTALYWFWVAALPLHQQARMQWLALHENSPASP